MSLSLAFLSAVSVPALLLVAMHLGHRRRNSKIQNDIGGNAGHPTVGEREDKGRSPVRRFS